MKGGGSASATARRNGRPRIENKIGPPATTRPRRGPVSGGRNSATEARTASRPSDGMNSGKNDIPNRKGTGRALALAGRTKMVDNETAKVAARRIPFGKRSPTSYASLSESNNGAPGLRRVGASTRSSYKTRCAAKGGRGKDGPSNRWNKGLATISSAKSGRFRTRRGRTSATNWRYTATTRRATNATATKYSSTGRSGLSRLWMNWARRARGSGGRAPSTSKLQM